MRFSVTAAAAAVAFASQTIAQCVTDSDATKVSQNFAQLFSNYSSTLADSVLSTDFGDQTDSVAWLINNGTSCPQPFGVPTFTTRAQFEAAQGSQPDLPFTVLNVYHDCSHVFIRWRFDVTPQPVQGISILGVKLNIGASSSQVKKYGLWLIQKLYTEFNSGAFAIDFGVIPGNRVSPAACS